MKTMLRGVFDGEVRYSALMFVCPGCLEFGGTGIHTLAVNSNVKKPSWEFDGNFEKPTLKPSILTRYSTDEGKTMQVCHSFLLRGVFEFLNDCTHSLAGQKVDIPDLPDWVTDFNENEGGNGEVSN